MKYITESDISRELRAPKPGYLFFGDEDYTKLHALGRMRQAICPDESTVAFNDIRISALDYTPERLLDSLELFPMLGDRKLVTLSGLDFGLMRQDELGSLCEVLAQLGSYDYNTLILCVSAGAIDEGRLPNRPGAALAKLAEFLTPVRFAKCTPAKLALWVGRHFDFNGVTASPELCALTVDYCGTGMFTLAEEIDKLSWYVRSQGRTELTADDIRFVSIPDNSYDAFAFANAITVGDRKRALDILLVMKQQKLDPTVIMGDISRVFCDLLTVKALADEGCGATVIADKSKMHEYRVGIYLSAVKNVPTAELRRIVAMCTDADAAVKLSPRGYEAIERLICGL